MEDTNRFYVYEWYIVDSNKIFYVGKGTGKRQYNISSRNPDFKQLCKDFKTKSRVVYDNLTEDEAIELEARHMLKRKIEGEILVNTIDEYDFIDWDDFDDKTMAFIDKECDDSEYKSIIKREFVPYIKVRDFIKRYYDYPSDIRFDSVDIDNLFCFLNTKSEELHNNRIQEEVAFIKNASYHIMADCLRQRLNQ